MQHRQGVKIVAESKPALGFTIPAQCFGRYAGAQGGVDVTSLISPDEVARIAHMNMYLDSFVDAGVTSDVLLNLESMQRAFAAGGDPDINMTDWQQLVERRLGEGDASRAAIEQALTASAGG